MKRIKAFKNVLFFLTVALLSAAIIAVVAIRLSGMHILSVVSGSMEPEIHVGSLIVTKPVEFEAIEVGDDITFVRDESLTLVTHRVVAIDTELRAVTTQGIKNNTPDRPVHYDNIVGRVVYSVPYLGYPISYISNTRGKIIVCTAFAALVIFIIILGVIFEKDEGKGEAAKAVKDEEEDPGS